MSNIKKNDKVEVLSGREKGRQGKILKIFRSFLRLFSVILITVVERKIQYRNL